MSEEQDKEKWITKVQTTLELTDEQIQEAQDEWDGMPEFVNDKKEEYRKVLIRFENEEDMKDFCNKIGQQITSKTKSLWHPKKEKDSLMRWMDDSNLVY